MATRRVRSISGSASCCVGYRNGPKTIAMHQEEIYKRIKAEDFKAETTGTAVAKRISPP
jgi:sRNA-binding carbon storage regulator CsrA